MAWAAVVVGGITAVGSYVQGEKNREAAEGAANEANRLQAIETAKLDKQKEEYKSMTFENPYENMDKQNFAEDVTVNQQQAQFQAQQGAQQRANIMQGLQGAAGGSGIAGLAQAMASQGQLQTQRISASIGQQEQANERLKIAGRERIAGVELQERKGEEIKQKFETDRQATLLGVQMGTTAGANESAQAAALNQQQVDAAATSANIGALGSLGGTIASNAGAIGNVINDPNDEFNWAGKPTG